MEGENLANYFVCFKEEYNLLLAQIHSSHFPAKNSGTSLESMEILIRANKNLHQIYANELMKTKMGYSFVL